MIRLFVLIFLGLALWQGSIHYRALLDPRPTHEVLVVNQCPVAILRVRVTAAAGETVVRERIEAGATSLLRFDPGPEGPFTVTWLRADQTLDTTWRGGRVGAPERHTLTIVDGRVTHQASPLPPRQGFGARG
jgi:hypothetical protein